MENKDSITFLRIEVILRRLSEERRFFFPCYDLPNMQAREFTHSDLKLVKLEIDSKSSLLVGWVLDEKIKLDLNGYGIYEGPKSTGLYASLIKDLTVFLTIKNKFPKLLLRKKFRLKTKVIFCFSTILMVKKWKIGFMFGQILILFISAKSQT